MLRKKHFFFLFSFYSSLPQGDSRVWAVVLAPNLASTFEEPARRPSQFLPVRSAPPSTSLQRLHRRSPLRPPNKSEAPPPSDCRRLLRISPRWQQRQTGEGRGEHVGRRSEAMQPKISAFFKRQEADPDPNRFFSLPLFVLMKEHKSRRL